MKFNYELLGKDSLKEKLEIADCVTCVRKSYTCYDIALDPTVASDMLFKSRLTSTGHPLFLIDFFSIWLLGRPWGTPCEPDPSFEQSGIPIYLDCFQMF